MSRIAALAALALLLAGGSPSGPPRPAGPSAAAAIAAPPVVTYSPPVPGPITVVRPFAPPPGRYAAGHRGVDLAVTPGQPVDAAAAGVVSFAGAVAGRGVVTIAHADGVVTEYEPVVPAVSAGQPVARGQPIGTVSGTHGGCVPGRCLHWGARRDGDYFDPMSLLRPLGPVRLLPW